MREHTNLPAMVRFVSKHVAQHFHSYWPRPTPAVSAKLFDAALRTAERFREHFSASNAALGQCFLGLLWRAVGAVELSRNSQVRRRKADPLDTNIVHVGEDSGDGAGFAGRFGIPGSRVQMVDKKEIHPIIGGESPGRGPAELSLSIELTADGLARGHGCLLLCA
jgi:hypothetical protein